MNRLFLSLCVIIFAFTLTAGGVFAVFQYAQSVMEPKTASVNITLGKFEYPTEPTFTQEMTDMMNYADGTNTYGLNSTAYYAQYTDPDAPAISDGVMHVYAKTSYSRRDYYYVGSMDNEYGGFFHADASISVVMRYAVNVGTDSIVYLYMAGSETVNAASVGQSITVFRTGYKYEDIVNPDGTTSAGYYLIKDAEGNPVIEKGTSTVQLYEGQTDGAKTFGVHNKIEIWQKD